VEHIYTKAKALVAAFRRSPSLESQLVAAQKQAIQKLLLGENQEQAINRVKRLQTAVDTRWSSFYRMLERICVLKDALISLGEEDLDYIHLDDEGQPTTVSSNLKKTTAKLKILC
jgi:hypothetical protein